MRYEKPVVADLSARAARGGPLACLAGSTPGGAEVCSAGDNGHTTAGDCLGGTEANGTGDSCVTGLVVAAECAAGTSPFIFGECTSGGTVDD